MGGSVWVRVPRVRMARPCFVLQRGGGGEGTGGPWKEEVSVGRDGGGVDVVRYQETPPCCVGGQEGHVRGHVRGQEAEGVHSGKDSSYGGDTATRQRVVMGQEVA